MISREKYYTWRRRILNENGYKKYSLYIIENMKELNKLLPKLK